MRFSISAPWMACSFSHCLDWVSFRKAITCFLSRANSRLKSGAVVSMYPPCSTRDWMMADSKVFSVVTEFILFTHQSLYHCHLHISCKRYREKSNEVFFGFVPRD